MTADISVVKCCPHPSRPFIASATVDGLVTVWDTQIRAPVYSYVPLSLLSLSFAALPLCGTLRSAPVYSYVPLSLLLPLFPGLVTVWNTQVRAPCYCAFLLLYSSAHFSSNPSVPSSVSCHVHVKKCATSFSRLFPP